MGKNSPYNRREMQPDGGRGKNGHSMTYCGQVVVTVVRMLLVLRIGSIVHPQKIHKTQLGVRLPVVFVMLHQLDPLGRLVNAKAGQQTASQHQTSQK